MVVADCFMVDKREEYKLYQTSLSPAKDNAFKEAVASLLYCVEDGDMNERRRQYTGTVVERFREIGGLPRYLFCNTSTYDTYMDDLSSASQNAVELWDSINKSNLNNIESSAKYFIAPVHMHCSSWRKKSDHVSMQFLSTYCDRIHLFFAYDRRFPTSNF